MKTGARPTAALTPHGLTSIGTGDGVNDTFDLPSSNMSGVTVYVNAIPQPSGNWSLSSGTGSGGVDQIIFGSGNLPTSGATVEFTGFSS